MRMDAHDKLSPRLYCEPKRLICVLLITTCDCAFYRSTRGLRAMDGVATNVKGWEDLPGAVLSHLLQLAPYKRADVKLVCQSWRVSINESIKAVSLPENDLDLLKQLTAVQMLTVTAACADASQQAGSTRASDSMAQGASSTSRTAPGYGGSANPWCSVHPSTLQRLRVLHLQNCPAALQQLAQWQTQQLTAANHSSSSAEDQPCSRPGLDSLQMLQLTNMVPADVAQLLPWVLFGCAFNACLANLHSADASSSSSAALKPWPLQHLSMLHISKCKLTGHERELSVLQQLPALQSLELSHCHIEVLPAAVCASTGLTQLNFAHNRVAKLPDQVSDLQSLKVFDLSHNTALCSLGDAFSSLTSLTELNLAGPNKLWDLNTGTAAAAPAGPVAPAAAAMPAVPNVHNLMLADDDDDDDDVMPDLLNIQEDPWVVNVGDHVDMPVLLHHDDGTDGVLPHEQQLQALPQLAHLSNLRKLSLAHNRSMRMLPASVCELTQLEVLDVRSCSLRFLDDELWECVGLRELLLGDNVLDRLPDDISKLQKLEVLDIGRCRSLWRLPGTLLALPELRRLVLATKAVGQHVVEQLELRSPNPVDVEFERDAHEDDWDVLSNGSEGFGVVGGDMPPPALVYGSEEDVTESESSDFEEGVPQLGPPVPGMLDVPDSGDDMPGLA